jgi:hypothetical protein
MPEALVDLATLWLQGADSEEITTAAVNQADLVGRVVVVVAALGELDKVEPKTHSI